MDDSHGQSSPETPQKTTLSRREFLAYAWGALISTSAILLGGLSLWNTQPRTQEDEFGGIFELDDAPDLNDSPVDYRQGRFSWSHTEAGAAAFYKVCPHLGCLVEWQEQSGRFECPCHGTTFGRDGRLLHGPSTRNLDQFAVSVVDQTRNGVDHTTGEHRYVKTGSGYRYLVDTGRRIPGEPAGRDT